MLLGILGLRITQCKRFIIVGSFIIKSQGQEEVKNLEDLLSKFNIRLVKTLLLSQSWESFQTWMRTGCGGRQGRGHQWSLVSFIWHLLHLQQVLPSRSKLELHLSIGEAVERNPQKTPFDPSWRYLPKSPGSNVNSPLPRLLTRSPFPNFLSDVSDS